MQQQAVSFLEKHEPSIIGVGSGEQVPQTPRCKLGRYSGFQVRSVVFRMEETRLNSLLST